MSTDPKTGAKIVTTEDIRAQGGGLTMTGKRKCFYIPEGQFDDKGYIPSLVTEGEMGHAPLKGNGPFSQPWYWGKTKVEAEEIAAKENERLGLSRQDVLEIVASSMGEQTRTENWLRGES